MPLREDTQGRKSKGWRAEWSWKRLLLFAGVLSAGLNISFLILVLTSESYIAENWSASPAVFYKPPPYVHVSSIYRVRFVCLAQAWAVCTPERYSQRTFSWQSSGGRSPHQTGSNLHHTSIRKVTHSLISGS